MITVYVLTLLLGHIQVYTDRSVYGTRAACETVLQAMKDMNPADMHIQYDSVCRPVEVQ